MLRWIVIHQSAGLVPACLGLELVFKIKLILAPYVKHRINKPFDLTTVRGSRNMFSLQILIIDSHGRPIQHFYGFETEREGGKGSGLGRRFESYLDYVYKIFRSLKSAKSYTKPYIYLACKVTPLPVPMQTSFKYGPLFCTRMSVVRPWLTADLACCVSGTDSFSSDIPGRTCERRWRRELCEEQPEIVTLKVKLIKTKYFW